MTTLEWQTRELWGVSQYARKGEIPAETAIGLAGLLSKNAQTDLIRLRARSLAAEFEILDFHKEGA